ncbi:NAD(P)H-dependent oxidoreductase [Chitinophaga sedimenti]|uniref:NAD(P)H-dependent oxidoreductase n=1 Tax=Chitinophaga sedimenti TaxID=2033606 RepID=UPI00249E1F75|nr:NAD(P)H-dependent oxidoreductase [Chitinophaga sedimenti]
MFSAPRGAASYSNQLGQAIVDQLLAAHPGSTVQTIDLSEQHYPHLSAAQLNSFSRRKKPAPVSITT